VQLRIPLLLTFDSPKYIAISLIVFSFSFM
jgi:hypothetical protein